MSGADIAQLLATAQAAQRSGDGAGAKAALEAVVARDPGNAAALNSLGVLAVNAGDVRGAIAWHQRATEADPHAPVLWVNLARAWRAVPDDFEERKALDRALSIDPTTVTALVRKGELHERRGEEVEALQTWQALIASAPDASHGGMDAILAHAHSYVRTRLDSMSAAMDAGLADLRSRLGHVRRAEACVDVMLGRRRIYVNECAGVHVPFLPADEFFERDHFPWLAALEAQTDVIRDELIALLESGLPGFAPYVQQAPGTPVNKWTPLDGSTAWNACHLWQYGQPVEAAQARCPKTVAALAAVPLAHVPGRMPNVFFSLMAPGAHIPPHTGVTNMRAIIHLPLIVPAGCWFRVGGETRYWQEGQAFAFDDTIEHEAVNPSAELRAVLIFDTWNPHLSADERTVLTAALAAADAAGIGQTAFD